VRSGRRPKRFAARVLAGGVALGAATLASSCGVPIAAAPTAIPPGQVPAALSVAPATLPAVVEPDERRIDVTVYLVNALQQLVPSPVTIGRPGSFQAILTSLANGPDGKATSLGYGTDLPAGVSLTAMRVTRAGVAQVEVGGGFLAQGGQTAIGEFAQVVYSLYASLPFVGIPGVKGVQFFSGGVPTGALLVDGQLVPRPVTADDYKSLLAPAP